MNEVKAYGRAKALVERRFAFLIHLAIYIPVVAVVIFLDHRLNPVHDQRWAWIVAWAWGIGLATHGVSVFLLADTCSRTPLAATLRERRVSFYLHLFAYLNTVVLMLVVHRYSLPSQTADVVAEPLLSNWWIWPTLGWGIGVLYHFLFFLVLRGWRVKKMKQAWTLKVMQQIDGVDRPEKQSPPATDEEGRTLA